MSPIARLQPSARAPHSSLSAPPNFVRSRVHAPRGFAGALLIACLMLLAGPAMAGDWYASPNGAGTKDCMSAANACAGVQAAINLAAPYDTVHVGAGDYNFTSNRIRIETEGLQLIGENSPFASPYGNGVGEVAFGTPNNKASNASVLKAVSANASSCPGTTSAMIWVRNVKNVRVENLYIEVDATTSNTGFSGACPFQTLTRAKEGIVATGTINGLDLVNNYIKVLKGTGAIGIGVSVAGTTDSSVPSSEARGSGNFVSIIGNVVEPTASASALPKRAIALQNTVGLIKGNQVAATTQDMWIQSPTASGSNPAAQRTLKFEDNWYFSRLQLYLSAGNGLSEPVVIRNNHFIFPGSFSPAGLPSGVSSTLGNGSEAHSLRVMGAQAVATIIENNQFKGFRGAYRALWVMNRADVTIQDNVFTPEPIQGDFTAVLVGNREVWNGLPQPQSFGVTLLRNTFNANGATVGNKAKAILFVNDNDPTGVAPGGNLQVGDGTAANANLFDAGIGWYIALDDRTCSGNNHNGSGSSCNGTSGYAIGEGIAYQNGSNAVSQKRPFKWDVSAAGNTFGGVPMASMDQAQYDAVLAKTFDNHNKVQTAATVGNVVYGWSLPAQPPHVDITITLDPANVAKTGGYQNFSVAAHNNGGTGVVRARISAVRADDATIPMQSGGANAATDALSVEYDLGGWNTMSLALSGDGKRVSAIYPEMDVPLQGDDDLPPQAARAWFRVPGQYNVSAEIIDAADHNVIYGTQAFSITVTQDLSVSFTGNNPTVYNANPQPLAFSVSPAANPAVADLAAKVSLLYSNDSQAPTNAGTYALSAISVDSDYVISPSAATSYVINKAAGTVAFDSLAFDYNGQAHPLVATLQPVNTSCVVSPASVGPAIGSYEVTATCGDPNYDAAPLTAQASVGGANSVHVFETGSNYASVADALADAATLDGYTIQLAPGTYSGPIVLTKGIKLVGGVSFIDGSVQMLMAGPTQPPSTVIDGGNAALDGITVSNGVEGASISGFEIRNFTRDCVSARQGNNGLLVEESIVHHCGQHGIYANGNGGLRNVTVRNNEVYDVGNRGIVVWNGKKTDITVSGNSIHGPIGSTAIGFEDGSATGVQITANVIDHSAGGDTGISIMQLTSGSLVPRANVISDNLITDPGRLGIALMIPDGNGTDTGDGAIVVEGNVITGGPNQGALADNDRAGIQVIRRFYIGASQGQVDVTRGVVIRSNTVTGISKPGAAAGIEGYGIVVEGMGSTVEGNTLSGNDIGLQIQQGNQPGSLPGNSDTDVHSDWFDRGNTAQTCARVGTNTINSSVMVDQRVEPASASMLGGIRNESTGTWYCSFSTAIAAANAGDTLSVCVFRSMPGRDSGPCRAGVPVHAGPPFRRMPAG